MTLREKIISGVAVIAIGTAIFSYINYVEILGHGPNHGENPNPSSSTPQFSDTIGTYAIVYLKLESSGEIRANHAYFQTLCGKPTKECIDEEVHKIITKRFSNLNEWRNPDTRRYGPLAYTSATGASLISDFRNFYFGRKSRVYVYSDTDALRFDQTWPIMFTQFGVNTRNIANEANWQRHIKDPNKTIYNAKTISVGSINNSHLLYFENEFKNAAGHEPPQPPPAGTTPNKFVNLSINFNMWLRSTDGGEIPMVIDPDTGNGFGSPPPP